LLLRVGFRFGVEVIALVVDTATGAVLAKQTMSGIPRATSMLSADGNMLAIVTAEEDHLKVEHFDLSVSGRADIVAASYNDIPMRQGGVTAYGGHMMVGSGITDGDTVPVMLFNPFTRELRKVSSAFPDSGEAAFFKDGVVVVNDGEAFVFTSGQRSAAPATVDTLMWHACQRLCLATEWEDVESTCHARAMFTCGPGKKAGQGVSSR
jgi:hypothetical protein